MPTTTHPLAPLAYDVHLYDSLEPDTLTLAELTGILAAGPGVEVECADCGLYADACPELSALAPTATFVPRPRAGEPVAVAV